LYNGGEVENVEIRKRRLLRFGRTLKYFVLYVVKKDKQYKYEAEHNFYSKGFIVD